MRLGGSIGDHLRRHPRSRHSLDLVAECPWPRSGNHSLDSTNLPWIRGDLFIRDELRMQRNPPTSGGQYWYTTSITYPCDAASTVPPVRHWRRTSPLPQRRIPTSFRSQGSVSAHSKTTALRYAPLLGWPVVLPAVNCPASG